LIIQNTYLQRIRNQYLISSRDSLTLFKEITDIAEQIGLDAALALLEGCVIEKRMAWLTSKYSENSQINNAIMDGYHWFYENYLRVAVPKDGEIVEQTESRIIMRWWNPCPTLDACITLGLDTRKVCKLAYHKPVDTFLKQIHPQLHFERNYNCLRPHTAFCEEIIELNS